MSCFHKSGHMSLTVISSLLTRVTFPLYRHFKFNFWVWQNCLVVQYFKMQAFKISAAHSKSWCGVMIRELYDLCKLALASSCLLVPPIPSYGPFPLTPLKVQSKSIMHACGITKQQNAPKWIDSHIIDACNTHILIYCACIFTLIYCIFQYFGRLKQKRQSLVTLALSQM